MTTTTHARHRTPTAHVGAARLAGLGTMIRFILRRDRLNLPAWIIGHGLFVIYITAALPQLAPTQRGLAGLTTLLTHPVGRMFTGPAIGLDRKSTRLNSSHVAISYAVFCLKKKIKLSRTNT